MTQTTLKGFLALCLLSLLPISATAQEYFGRIAMEGVELQAAVKFGVLDYNERTTMAPGLYDLKYSNKFVPNKSAPIFQTNTAGGAVYHDGKIYIMAYDYSGNVSAEKPIWRTYDANTYELLSEVEEPANCEATTSNLAYDPTTDKIYGFLSTYTENFFVEINPETGAVKRVAQLTWDNKYTCIACNKQGQLYAIYYNKNTSEHYLAKIRKTDGRMANIGTLVITDLLKDDAFLDGGYSQAMTFNNATDKLYWMFQSASATLSREEYVPILEVNTKTAVASMKAYINEDILFTGVFFKEPTWTAPAIIEDFAYTPTSTDRMTGKMSFALPKTDYIGNAFAEAEQLTVTVKEGEKTHLTVTGAPGTTVTSDDVKFTSGNHTVTIVVSNSKGEAGPEVSRTFFTGYDVPNVCQNIKLVADGLTTTLTWDPPTSGVNGSPINPDAYTYTVIRYPNEIVVAKNTKERIFVEEHPADMTRYVYRVYANDPDAGAGKPAYSNNLIVGTPLDVPYGGYFNEAADMFNYYTLIDNNHDGCSWSFDNNTYSAFYRFSNVNDGDDYMISPPINYKKGKTYTLKFMAYSQYAAYPEALEVKFGADRTPEGQSQRLLYIDEVPGVSEDSPVQEFSVNFTVPEDGVYYYSMHAVSPAFSYYLYVTNIRVAEATTEGINDALTDGAEPIKTEYFGLDGRRLRQPAAGQLVLVKKTYGDGKVLTEKKIVNQ